jgi:hypothetical protein
MTKKEKHVLLDEGQDEDNQITGYFEHVPALVKTALSSLLCGYKKFSQLK